MLLTLCAALAPLAVQNQDEDKSSWTVFADVLYTADGDQAIENASIVVQDGKIRAVTGGARPPSGDDALKAAAVTPGMIDLSPRVHDGFWSVEQSREIAADIRMANGLDPFDEDWMRQARSGVTTALASPPDENVVGGMSIAIKTAGGHDISKRTVKADAALRGSMGTQPSARNHPAGGRPTDFYSRRPTTRMGVEWEWRKAFYDAAAAKRDDARAFPGSEELGRVLDGEVPMIVQAWATQDIRTAVFLVEELEREGLGKARLIVDAAAEAWKEPQLLVRSGAAVVLPPYPSQGRTNDRAFYSLGTAAQLHELGVPIALSGHGASQVTERIDRQAGWAMRGGLPFDAALAAVTVNPARMIGIDDSVGTVEVGKDADLVLWSGKPFEAGSRVIGVLVDGRLVRDPRSTN